MAKLAHLATISTEFGIDPDMLESLGVIDVQLTTDTNLFIDPLLLPESAHQEINTGAATSYEQRFEWIIKLLMASEVPGDLPWRKVEKLFKFSEISWTCLGYGSSVNGSGFGPALSASALDTARQIVKLGVTDIDFFMGLSLFEEGIGPDRISDMTTNIILKDLVAFTDRVNKVLCLPVKEFSLPVDGERRQLPVNPYTGGALILVPRDIVRTLPVAADWSDVARVARENDELRERVSGHIGKVWSTMTKKQKAQLKDSALRSKESFESLLELIKFVPGEPYDFSKDNQGEVFWARIINKIASEHPMSFSVKKKTLDRDNVIRIVDEIILQFKELVENKGLWKELWTDEKTPRREKASQRLLFAIAYSYCKANNLDITPEADSGNGPVDFKFSTGFDLRIVVEVKLSTNGKLAHGYEKQLGIYKRADDTELGAFIVIDVGGLGKKFEVVQRLRREASERGESTSQIYYVDGNIRDSASKRV